MSDDEVFVFLASALLAGAAWLTWLWTLLRVGTRGPRPAWAARVPLLVAPVAGTVLLASVLRALASWDVRDSPVYLGFYLVLGAAWVGVTVRAMALFGLALRDDVAERGNRAAAWALSGALLGLTLCFAGGNIGDGPGWWVVVFSAALATLVFYALWLLLDRFTGLADVVTIGRDRAAGLRLAGLFVAIGLVLGRAVAGDWESTWGTVADFATAGWPAVALAAVAVLVERRLAPTAAAPLKPLVSQGLVPALFYVGAGVLVVAESWPWA